MALGPLLLCRGGSRLPPASVWCGSRVPSAAQLTRRQSIDTDVYPAEGTILPRTVES